MLYKFTFKYTMPAKKKSRSEGKKKSRSEKKSDNKLEPTRNKGRSTKARDKRLKTFLIKNRIQIIEVPGDGSCFLYSILEAKDHLFKNVLTNKEDPIADYEHPGHFRALLVNILKEKAAENR